MNSILQDRFDHIESALDNLVESITSYNPSISSASILIAADDDLNQTLDQLSEHQSNHSLALSLRELSYSLDERIKVSIKLLSETRKDLLGLSSTLNDDQLDAPQSVEYGELLAYAQHIGKNSVPRGRKQIEGESLSGIEIEHDANATALRETSGLKMDQATLDFVHDTAAAETSHLAQTPTNEVKNLTTLDPALKEWLDPDSNVPRVPWPSDDVIRSGALSRIQAKLDQKTDPSQLDLNAEGRKHESIPNENEHLIEASSTHRRQSFATGSSGRRPTADELRAEARKKEEMFQDMNLYNPDDDDDDDD